MTPNDTDAWVPVDIPNLIAAGGRSLVDFLQFGVVSVQPEPVFAVLAREYRYRPTLVGALALFDVFCVPNAPFRLRISDRLPPRELALATAVRPLRAAWDRSTAPRPAPQPCEEPPLPEPLPMPSRTLYTALEECVLTGPESPLLAVAATYNPSRGPIENLPGGKMTAAQRTFVNAVWLKRVRPTLVAGGFWRVATIGQP